mgnify:CR=1 FL=1
MTQKPVVQRQQTFPFPFLLLDEETKKVYQQGLTRLYNFFSSKTGNDTMQFSGYSIQRCGDGDKLCFKKGNQTFYLDESGHLFIAGSKNLTSLLRDLSSMIRFASRESPKEISEGNSKLTSSNYRNYSDLYQYLVQMMELKETNLLGLTNGYTVRHDPGKNYLVFEKEDSGKGEREFVLLPKGTFSLTHNFTSQPFMLVEAARTLNQMLAELQRGNSLIKDKTYATGRTVGIELG